MFELSKKNIINISIFALIIFVIAIVASAFQLNPAIDAGREFYIPFRMISGEVLYKDIFNIYGPFAYQINSFAYMVFGADVFALRIFGAISAAITMTACFYILSNVFSDKGFQKYLLLPLIIGILSFGTFNYVVPYAFSMTYGLSFFLVSLAYLIGFSKTEKKYFVYLSCFFSGAAVACKYEFFGWLIFVVICLLFSKKLNLKEIVFSLVSLVLIPMLSFGILFFQGLSISNLSDTSSVLKTMANSQAIKYLYENFTGTYFNFYNFLFCFLKTILLIVVASFSFFALKFYKNDKFLLIVTILFIFTGFVYIGVGGFSLFAVINALIFFSFIKKIVQNKPVFLFMSASLLLSLKTFFAVNLDVYGTYTLPFVLLSIVAFVYKIDFSDKENVKTWAKSTMTMIVFGIMLISVMKSVNIFIKKSGAENFILCERINDSGFFKKFKNLIYTYSYIAKPINQTALYILKNTKESDIIVVIPETQFLNFITKRPADNLYDSLTPMYFETFGEENVINHFKETNPEYFILNNRDTSDYGKRYICDDYGKQFCIFIKDNYEKVAVFGEKQYILQVFKRKDIK